MERVTFQSISKNPLKKMRGRKWERKERGGRGEGEGRERGGRAVKGIPLL